jgi:alpha-L-rhamnosidase
MNLQTAICIVMLSFQWACASNAPTGLMCELLSDPNQTTIADATPEFGWIVNSDASNDTQTAYQILVASTPASLGQDQGDKWDSGKTTSDNSINVAYAGSALAVNSTYFWKVRTWNKNGQLSDWSAIQSFKTAASFSAYSTARYPLVCTPIAPVKIRTVGPGHYFIDFGKDAFGYLQWTLPPDKLVRLNPGTNNQTTVEVHFGEKLENNLIDRTLDKSTIRYYKVNLQLAAGTRVYDIHPPKDKRNTSGEAILIPAPLGVICPFRYIELVNCPVEPKPEQLRQIAVHYPFDAAASAFQCDNSILNQVWDICKYSMKATSFTGIYVDGDRERIPYEADAYINQLSHYAVDREFSIARYSHEYLLTHPTWPTEWRQHSIIMAWADYMYTGNSESLAANYDMLKNDKLLLRHARADGLLNTPDSSIRNIVDWPAAERDGYDMKPVNTVVNAFHYINLLQMKQLAEVLGKTADAQTFGQKADTVYQAFQNVFFNTATGLYIDGDGSTHSALHANMLPLAFGLVPENKKSTVANFVKSRGMACSVYGAQYLMDALYLAGEEDYALSLMTSTAKRSWYNMIAVGSTITLEAWDIQYKPNLDWNHAWGAVPGNIIPRFVMGIGPMEPGFKKALIQPRPGTLKNAQIVTPTIRGNIEESFVKQGQNDYDFVVKIPANMTARFVLPAKKTYTQVTLDGSAITPQTQGTMQYIDPVGSGSHTITCR